MPRNNETAQNMAPKIMSVVTAQNKKTNAWLDTLCETIHAWVVLSFLYAGAYPAANPSARDNCCNKSTFLIRLS